MHPAADFNLSELTATKAQPEQGEQGGDSEIWVGQGRIRSFFPAGGGICPFADLPLATATA